MTWYIEINFETLKLWLQLYKPFNIYIALVGIENWTEGDRCSITTEADSTLENFLHYRKERINPSHPNDNSQLITWVKHRLWNLALNSTYMYTNDRLWNLALNSTYMYTNDRLWNLALNSTYMYTNDRLWNLALNSSYMYTNAEINNSFTY